MSRDNPDHHGVSDVATLEALYGQPSQASLVKEVDHLHPHYAAFVQASSFMVLATIGPCGLDASPRGDKPGFVVVADASTLLLPDRRGNNRVDSLRNIVADPRVAMLFLVPGIGETLRVNGRARISIDPALIERFTVDGHRPRTVLEIRIETVFFQCSRAVVRADLWNPATHVARSALPSNGAILSALTQERFDGETYDRTSAARIKASLY